MSSKGNTRGADDVVVDHGKPVATGDARPPAETLRPGQLPDPGKQGISNRPGDQEEEEGVDPAPGNEGEDR